MATHKSKVSDFRHPQKDEEDFYYKKIYPQLVSNTRSGRGMRCNEAPIL